MDRKRKVAVGIGVGVLLAFIGACALTRKGKAAPPTPTPPPTPLPGLANLYGKVTNKTGAPLAGVAVRLDGLVGDMATSINPSNSSGYYLITGCGGPGSGITLPGTYQALFTKNGYQSKLIEGINLVEGNNLLNVQLTPVPAGLEIPYPGFAFLGVNGQPIVKKYWLPNDVRYVDENGIEMAVIPWGTTFAEFATPIISADVAELTLNLRLESRYSVTVDRQYYLPTQPPIDGMRAIADPWYAPSVSVSSLPANADLYLKSSYSTPYGPLSLLGTPGETYDLWLYGFGGSGLVLKDIVRCP